jgi:hypothetical protein
MATGNPMAALVGPVGRFWINILPISDMNRYQAVRSGTANGILDLRFLRQNTLPAQRRFKPLRKTGKEGVEQHADKRRHKPTQTDKCLQINRLRRSL